MVSDDLEAEDDPKPDIASPKTPDHWRRVKLVADGNKFTIMSYAGTIFGPLALLALGLTDNPKTIQIPLKTALTVGERMEQALIEGDTKPAKRRKA